MILVDEQEEEEFLKRRGDYVENRDKKSVREYYEKNKEWLQKIAQSSDIVVRSMALAVLELGSDPEQ